MKKNTASFYIALFILSFGMFMSLALSLPEKTSAAQLNASDSGLAANLNINDSQINQNLLQRVQTISKNRADQVKGAIDEMTLQKRGFIGEVQRVIEQTITVKNSQETQVLTLSPTVVLMKDGKKATIDDIAVGDWVVAVGYTDKQGFLLKQLFVSSVSLIPPHYDTTIGNVLSIARTSLQLQPRSINQQQQPVDYVLNKLTKYENVQSNPLLQSDVETDSQYLVISYNNKNQKIVTLMHAIGSGTTAASPSP